MGATMSREVTEGSSTATYNYQFTDGTATRGGILMHWYTANDPAFYASGGTKLTTVYGYNGLSAGHEYEMTFHTSINYNGRYTIKVFIDSNKLFESEFSGDSNKKINVKFTAPEAITDSTRIMIQYSVGSGYSYGASGQNVRYFISENLSFSDLTDNPSWLGKIVQKFSDLGDSIGGFIEGLKQSISDWFEEQKQKIQDFSDSVGQWFDDLKLKIENTFQAAVDEIKSWFIPSDGYFDRKKEELETFAVEHFGAMYQAPDVIVDLIKKFTTMSPKEPAITFPAIQFDFNGTRYTLSESVRYTFSWVNDNGQAVYYFYHFYRGFVTVILFVGFANYCIKKYNEVFGGGSE